MNSELDRTEGPGSRPDPRVVAALALLSALALATATFAHPVRESGGVVEARNLHSAIAQMTELAQRRLRPPVQSLAGELPGEASRLGKLRDPATTVEAQLSVALNEMRQMNALTTDQHYLPALLAVGRAFSAASGRDPLTGTTINPEYLGLERELAGSGARLEHAAGESGKLSAAVRRLVRELTRSRRRARRLERRVERMGAREARLQRG